MATSVFLGVNEAVRPPPSEDLRSNCANPGFAPVVKACARPLEATTTSEARPTCCCLMPTERADAVVAGGPPKLCKAVEIKRNSHDGMQRCLSVRFSNPRCKPVGTYRQETEPIGIFCARMYGLPESTCIHDVGSAYSLSMLYDTLFGVAKIEGPDRWKVSLKQTLESWGRVVLLILGQLRRYVALILPRNQNVYHVQLTATSD